MLLGWDGTRHPLCVRVCRQRRHRGSSFPKPWPVAGAPEEAERAGTAGCRGAEDPALARRQKPRRLDPSARARARRFAEREPAAGIGRAGRCSDHARRLTPRNKAAGRRVATCIMLLSASAILMAIASSLFGGKKRRRRRPSRPLPRLPVAAGRWRQASDSPIASSSSASSTVSVAVKSLWIAAVWIFIRCRRRRGRLYSTACPSALASSVARMPSMPAGGTAFRSMSTRAVAASRLRLAVEERHAEAAGSDDQDRPRPRRMPTADRPRMGPGISRASMRAARHGSLDSRQAAEARSSDREASPTATPFRASSRATRLADGPGATEHDRTAGRRRLLIAEGRCRAAATTLAAAVVSAPLGSSITPMRHGPEERLPHGLPHGLRSGDIAATDEDRRRRQISSAACEHAAMHERHADLRASPHHAGATHPRQRQWPRSHRTYSAANHRSNWIKHASA